jgi:pimeloyl-ACP methyl ester carboxylesterase
VTALEAGGFRAIRLDLRGFGESRDALEVASENAMDSLAGDLEALIREHSTGRIHLVGHSLGGMICQRYAVEHPDRLASLVLASTTSHNGRRASAFARAMQLFSEYGFDRVLEDPEHAPEVHAALKEAFLGVEPPLEMLRVGLEQPNPARAFAWRACVDFSMKDRLRELTCPVLVLHGSADPLIPFRAGELVRDAIPNAEWMEESGAGHSLPSERAESFNQSVIDFIRRASG